MKSPSAIPVSPGESTLEIMQVAVLGGWSPAWIPGSTRWAILPMPTETGGRGLLPCRAMLIDADFLLATFIFLYYLLSSSLSLKGPWS